MQKPDPFPTSDTALAAYLDYHRHKLVGFKPENNDPKRLMFVFVKEDRTDDLANEFYNGKTVINLTEYAKSIRHMYAALRESKDAKK